MFIHLKSLFLFVSVVILYVSNFGIFQAVLRTVYARVMQVLVQNRNWLAVVAAKNFPSASVQAREVSKASVNAFGALQKNTNGLDLVLNQVQKLFREKMLPQPDAIVIPHGTMAYLQLCKPENKVSITKAPTKSF